MASVTTNYVAIDEICRKLDEMYRNVTKYVANLTRRVVIDKIAVLTNYVATNFKSDERCPNV